MSTGTKGGLLIEKRAQSVFKHSILKQYLPRFIAKTGTSAPRVVLVDGYAGTGSSGSGPGSATLMLEAAQATGSTAGVSVYLVESDAKNYQELAKVADLFRENGVRVEAHQGSIADELPPILDASESASLFLFLDPCGALVPFGDMASVFGERRGAKRPPTEGFLNFSDDLVRRCAGQFLAESQDQEGARRLDEVCGGTWWRDIATRLRPQSSTDTYEEIASEVAAEYAHRLAAATRMTAITIPVRRKLERQAVYHLIFLTRHSEGVWSFVDSLGVARPDWLAAMPDDPDQSEPDLFSEADVALYSATAAAEMRRKAVEEQASTVVRLTENISAIASSNPQFRLIDYQLEVFAGVLGVATEKQVSAAIRELQDRITLVTNNRRVQRRTYRRRF
jgi:three-Cys-motif partner protein